MVEYACFLVKCIIYKNLMCLRKIYFSQDLARFSLSTRAVLNQRCSALKTQCFRLLKNADSKPFFCETTLFSVNQCWIFQFWTAVIQRKSDLICSETALISADVFQFLWISFKKRQISEKTLLSAADYLWDFNSGALVPMGHTKLLQSLSICKNFETS